MRILSSLFFLILLSACGNFQEHSLDVHVIGDLPAQHVKWADEQVQANVQALRGSIWPVQHYYAWEVSDMISADGKKAFGLTSKSEKTDNAWIYVYEAGHLYNESIIVHELIHLYLKGSDHNHTDPKLWLEAAMHVGIDFKETVEWKLTVAYLDQWHYPKPINMKDFILQNSRHPELDMRDSNQ